MLVRLLVAINEGAQRERVRRLLDGAGGHVELCPGAALWERLAETPVDIVIVGRSALGDPAWGAIAAFRRLPDAPEVVLLCNSDPYEERGRFLAAGCLAVLYTGLSDGALRDVFRALVDRRFRHPAERGVRGWDGSAGERLRPLRLDEWMTESAGAQTVVAQARRAARRSAPLLLIGEAGCALETLAHAIHLEGRPLGPFVAARCHGTPPDHVARALFGGPSPGAAGVARAARGHVERAHGGTLYLDEICALPIDAQKPLAGFLQAGTLDGSMALDVRLIAATRRDPTDAVRDGQLDAALFDRIRGEVIVVPPLRERMADVPGLAERWLADAAARHGIAPVPLGDETREELLGYPWPGNDAELAAVMTRAALLAREHREVTPATLPPSVVLGDARTPVASSRHRPAEAAATEEPEAGESKRSSDTAVGVPVDDDVDGPADTGDAGASVTHPAAAGAGPADPSAGLVDRPLKDARRLAIARFERAYLAAHLEATRGRVGETAARIGITPRALYEKMRALDLRKETFRS